MTQSGVPFGGARRAAAYQEPEAEPVVRAVPEPRPEDAPEPVSAPAETPVSHDDDFSLLSQVATVAAPAAPLTGWRKTLSAVGIKLGPSAKDAAAAHAAAELAEAEAVIRQTTFTRAAGVLVANKKGGSGKTPTSLLLGGVTAAIRGGSVAILEVSDDPGALTFRAEGNPDRGVGQLVDNIASISSKGQLDGYTAPQTSHASVIGSTGRRRRLTDADVRAASAVIDTYYSVRVMDSGNQPTSSAFQGAVDTADVLVIPVLNAGDAVLEAVAMLDELRASGERGTSLADQAIVLRLHDGRPEHPQVVERVARLLDRANVAHIYDVPYDAHIAERGQLTLSNIAPATRAAFTHAAAGMFQVLKKTVR